VEGPAEHRDGVSLAKMRVGRDPDAARHGFRVTRTMPCNSDWKGISSGA
jgi:hypothetical protein